MQETGAEQIRSSDEASVMEVEQRDLYCLAKQIEQLNEYLRGFNERSKTKTF
jgi:hypothetical protein